MGGWAGTGCRQTCIEWTGKGGPIDRPSCFLHSEQAFLRSFLPISVHNFSLSVDQGVWPPARGVRAEKLEFRSFT